MSVDEVPIGRRVAQWRVRRRMTQQMLADRLGKSKSWVDKVERGVRALDRFSVIQELAAVLRVDPAAILGQASTPSPTSTVVASDSNGVDAVRTVLARYDFSPPGYRAPLPAGELGRRVGHAWLTYQHAHYPRLLKLLPALLTDAQHANAAHPAQAAGLLVQVYRVTSSVLVKLGEADLAWLAADRAMAAAAGDRLLAAVAAVPLAQALRALRRDRLAMAAALAAAHRVAPSVPRQGTPDELSVLGTLLLQAALAAAGCGDRHAVSELVDQATGLAGLVGEDHDHQWTGFGPTAVEAARVVAATELGDTADAISHHENVIRQEHWSRLPAEHRAAHLIDAARAYLHAGDLTAAGRALLDADHTAPAETRSRPAARTVIAAVARGGPATAGVSRLAATLGIT